MCRGRYDDLGRRGFWRQAGRSRPLCRPRPPACDRHIETIGLLEPRSKSRALTLLLIGRCERIGDDALWSEGNNGISPAPAGRVKRSVCGLRYPSEGRGHDTSAPPWARAFPGAGIEMGDRMIGIIEIDGGDLRDGGCAAASGSGGDVAVRSARWGRSCASKGEPWWWPGNDRSRQPDRCHGACRRWAETYKIPLSRSITGVAFIFSGQLPLGATGGGLGLGYFLVQ